MGADQGRQQRLVMRIGKFADVEKRCGAPLRGFRRGIGAAAGGAVSGCGGIGADGSPCPAAIIAVAGLPACRWICPWMYPQPVFLAQVAVRGRFGIGKLATISPVSAYWQDVPAGSPAFLPRPPAAVPMTSPCPFSSIARPGQGGQSRARQALKQVLSQPREALRGAPAAFRLARWTRSRRSATTISGSAPFAMEEPARQSPAASPFNAAPRM